MTAFTLDAVDAVGAAVAVWSRHNIVDIVNDVMPLALVLHRLPEHRQHLRIVPNEKGVSSIDALGGELDNSYDLGQIEVIPMAGRKILRGRLTRLRRRGYSSGRHREAWKLSGDNQACLKSPWLR